MKRKEVISVTRAKRHNWTLEQESYLKDLVLPITKKERDAVAVQFNKRHGTKLTSGQVYMKALNVQGKLEGKKGKKKVKAGKRARRKKQLSMKKTRQIHRYTSDEEKFILEEYPEYRGRPGKMKSFLRKFNRTFKIKPGLKIHAFGQKCITLYADSKKGKQQLPSLPVPTPTNLDSGVRFVIYADGKEVWSGDHKPLIRCKRTEVSEQVLKF